MAEMGKIQFCPRSPDLLGPMHACVLGLPACLLSLNWISPDYALYHDLKQGGQAVDSKKADTHTS